MKMKKAATLCFILILCLFVLTGCSSQSLGYRKYPHVLVNPSTLGEMIKLRLPLDEHIYIYSSYGCEQTESGIDLTIHFTKSK